MASAFCPRPLGPVFVSGAESGRNLHRSIDQVFAASWYNPFGSALLKSGARPEPEGKVLGGSRGPRWRRGQ
eukprot:7383434-Lingulodinium_polyedra.AAC.1